MSAIPKAARPAAWWRRSAAALALLSALLHLAAVPGSLGQAPAMTALMLTMTLGCLYCAKHLWTRGALRDWAWTALMNIGMIAAHLAILSPGAAHAHHHTAGGTVPSGHTMSALMTAAIVTAAIEAALAGATAFRVRPRDSKLDSHEAGVTNTGKNHPAFTSRRLAPQR